MGEESVRFISHLAIAAAPGNSSAPVLPGAGHQRSGILEGATYGGDSGPARIATSVRIGYYRSLGAPAGLSLLDYSRRAE